ncbi:MAG: 30S ribosomal protein S1 [Clostridia bacterium]|nr:30S ribosomal protein S1 [Clostridia bacterium]
MKKYLPEGHIFDTKENKLAFHSPLSLADAYTKNQLLEARATMCDSEHNLIVDLDCMKGIIPRCEGAIGIEDGSVRDIAIISRVGKPVCFVITGFDVDEQNQPIAILSRRKAQKMCMADFIAKLEIGDVISAKVTHLEPFGAFCDIGCGIPSLLPIDAISVSRISHPKDRFSPGDNIKAVVKSIENGRITLSQKELLGSWAENAQLFSQGQTVSGIIRSVEDYGVFVELMPNLAGLAEPKDGVYPSQQASVYIKSIIPEKMKVKLIIIDSFDAFYTPKPVKYFYTGNHIESWQYSPMGSGKVIESVFAV